MNNGSENLEIVNDFGVIEATTRSEVDMQVATAKRWPRSLDAFNKRALTLATRDAEVAQSCFYALPRGGKKIEGPGIRLAEIVAASWGNLRCESRVVAEGRNKVTAQSTVWDMENNVLMRAEVSRRITDRNGKRYGDDMIIMAGNAACSVALRNAIFKIVPFSHVKKIYDQCKKIALGGGGVEKAKHDWVEYYKKLDVTEDQILACLGVGHMDDVGLDEVSTLQGLATAINEGQTTVAEAFPLGKLPQGTSKFGRQQGKG